MTFKCLKIQEKKIKIEDDDANHDAETHELFKGANEDMLLEIFIRVPDYRSSICSSIVCHSWHSVISHHPQFIPRFISHHHQHQDRYPPPPFTILFRKADKGGFTGDFQPICKLFSEDSTCCTSPNFLDFLPSLMVIRASCSDLLLVSPGARWLTNHYICNPITKQFYQLPEIPRPEEPRHVSTMVSVMGHALVCMPGGGPTNQFKVVEFHHPHFPDQSLEPPHYTIQPTMIFCSESGEWEQRCLLFPVATRRFGICSLDVVTCNGILYWLEYESRVDRVLYLDLTLKHVECGVIAFPGDSYYDLRCVKEQIGVVRGRGGELELRLIQVVVSTCFESIVHLKVWKLINKDDNDWVLVHHKKKLKMPKNDEEHQFVAPFVHPTNGDVVFLVWGADAVFRFDLKDPVTTTYEMIDKLQEPLVTNTGWVPNNDRLLSFPIVHPTWPTRLPNRQPVS